jgi:large subunit ribosomal protein L28
LRLRLETPQKISFVSFETTEIREIRSPHFLATRFAFCVSSANIKASVFYPLNRRKCEVMALKCSICGKGPHYGNVVSHANNTRRRRWNPNLKNVRAVVNGARKQVRVCTACIRLGRVKKAA